MQLTLFQPAEVARSTPLQTGSLLETMVEILGETGAAVAGLFKMMEVADTTLVEEVGFESSKELFNASRPRMPEMSTVAAWVYRAHLLQLCDRWRTGKSAAQATDTELLLMLVNTSLAAPLNQSARAAYIELFSRSMSRVGMTRPGLGDLSELARQSEPWPGETEERIEDMRRRIRFEDRSFKKVA